MILRHWYCAAPVWWIYVRQGSRGRLYRAGVVKERDGWWHVYTPRADSYPSKTRRRKLAHAKRAAERVAV